MSDATVKQLSAIETLRVASEMVSDRIAELEAELAEKNEWNVELDQLNIKLMAQIEAVGELPHIYVKHSGRRYE